MSFGWKEDLIQQKFYQSEIFLKILQVDHMGLLLFDVLFATVSPSCPSVIQSVR